MCRWCAWDSNPGPQDGRCRRNHRDMASAVHFLQFQLFLDCVAGAGVTYSPPHFVDSSSNLFPVLIYLLRLMSGVLRGIFKVNLLLSDLPFKLVIVDIVAIGAAGRCVAF